MTKENPSIGEQIRLKEIDPGFDRVDQIFAAYEEYKEKDPQLRFFLLDKNHHIEFFGKRKDMKSSSLEDDLLVVLSPESEDQFNLLKSFGKKNDEFNVFDKYGNKFSIPFEEKRMGKLKPIKINKKWTDYIDLDAEKEGKKVIRDVKDLRNLLAKR